MNAIPPVQAHELERLRYWKGQRLLSRDFRDQRSMDEQHRWWHNRAMHQAYGIASGFEAVLTGGHVELRPGIAYDCFGRELILFERKKIPVPPQADKAFALLIRYKERGDYHRKMQVGGACMPGGGALFHEKADLLWQPADTWQTRDGVLLAMLNKGELSRAEALMSRPISRPRIATDSMLPGASSWNKWTFRALRNNLVLGAQIAINTSAVGFPRTPCYFAWLDREAGQKKGDLVLEAQLALFRKEHIATAAPDGFLFRVLIFGGEQAFQQFVDQRWSVTWLAIECDCHPHSAKTKRPNCEHP